MHAAANTFPFNLRVVEARNLFASKRDIADPFVVVKLKGLKHIFNSEKQSTEVQMNRENPVFNQDFLLHPKENDTILVKVMDKNTPLNRKLGKVFIPVSTYLNRGVVDSWFPLEGKGERNGEVHLLINFGGKSFTGFRDYLASRSGLGTKSAHGVPAPLMHSGRTEGTTIVKETKVSREVPLATQPMVAPVAPMANLNLGAPASTTIHADTVKSVQLARDTVVQERIHPVEEEIIQPVIHRERQQTEIHRVQQDIAERNILPTVYQDKMLAAEYRGDYTRSRDFLAEETNTRAAVFSTRDIDSVQHHKVINAPIVEETIKKTVIEVVQPVVHRETTAPVVIRETLPIYEKVIEEPIVYNDVRSATSINMGTTQFAGANTFPQTGFVQQPSLIKETIITQSTTVEPSSGAKILPTAQTRPGQTFQSF
eukprot:TRINITY_DN1251_c0_g1_i7.p1 TRINITY_DN1251_c0_g1~~TRINITY_DN1251_c0_g1_i7.p1  ORF type:complete len:450 (+),score=143.63 TRINITY_DN1251_c0_g1_i7:73-1350(+)